MTFDPSKPVQTRDGRKARIICTDRKHPDGPIVALIEYPESSPHAGDETYRSYYADGRYYPSVESPTDLVNVPVVTHKYNRLYRGSISSNSLHFADIASDTEQQARDGRSKGFDGRYIGLLESVIIDGVVTTVNFIPWEKPENA